MRLSPDDLQELSDLAITAARTAGEMVATTRPQNVEHKAQGTSLASQVVTEIDRRAEEMIVETLGPSFDRFELGLLTEETPDDGGRLTADHFWCIDPIDGTLPFIEGIPGYAVSVGLVGRDGTPMIGVVFDPVEQTLYHAVRGHGAFRNGDSWPLRPETPATTLSFLVNRSFHERDDKDSLVASFNAAAEALGLDDVSISTAGGAVMNVCTMLASAPACYFTLPGPLGGASLWDYAATACIATEASAAVADIHGDPLDLNRADSTYMNHRGVLFATDAALAQDLRDRLGE